MDVGQRLQVLLDERGWSAYKLAQEADMSWSTIRNVLQKGSDPGVATLEAICKGLGITMVQFFDTDNSLGLTQEQCGLFTKWSQLDEKSKAALNDIIHGLLHKR